MGFPVRSFHLYLYISLSFQEYSREIRDDLVDKGLQWFADNPCMTAAEISSLIEYGISEDKFRAALIKKRTAIEATVSRYTLDNGQFHRNKGHINSQLRCVLFGNIGEGKSSLGNLLLGATVFKVSNSAATGTKTIEYASSHKHNIKVIDTPGFADPTDIDMKLETSKVILMKHFT